MIKYVTHNRTDGSTDDLPELVCSASIIHTNYVITAAHCLTVTDYRKYGVIVGSTKVQPEGQKHRLEYHFHHTDVFKHDDYEGVNLILL